MFILWTVNKTYQINPLLFCMIFFELFSLYNIINGIICIKNSSKSTSGYILLGLGLLECILAIILINSINPIKIIVALFICVAILSQTFANFKHKKCALNIIEFIGTLLSLIALIIYLVK